jgi:RecJ-like exonuclease
MYPVDRLASRRTSAPPLTHTILFVAMVIALSSTITVIPITAQVGASAPVSAPAGAGSVTTINQITAGSIDSTVTIEGQITNMYGPSSPQAPYSFYVTDGTETIRIVIWQNIYKNIPNPSQFTVGSRIRVTGKVRQYRNNLEIHLENPAGIRLATEVAATPAPVTEPEKLSPEKEELTPLKNIDRSKLGKVVQVRGKVINFRASWAERAPNTLTISDGTESLPVVYWKDLEEQLKPEQRPKVGEVVELKATVDEYRNELQLKLFDAKHLRIIPPEELEKLALKPTPVPTPRQITPIAQITKDAIAKKVTIQGKITGARSIRNGTLLTITDSSGSIVVPFWDSIASGVPKRDQIKEGANILLQGTVFLYEQRDQIEIELESPLDIIEVSK